jgi:transcriptional regulator with XRE-family HTH domain
MPRPIHPVRTMAAARGMTQVEIATLVGISPVVLTQVLSHRMASWPRLRRALAEVFGVEESELFPDVATTNQVAS